MENPCYINAGKLLNLFKFTSVEFYNRSFSSIKQPTTELWLGEIGQLLGSKTDIS